MHKRTHTDNEDDFELMPGVDKAMTDFRARLGKLCEEMEPKIGFQNSMGVLLLMVWHRAGSDGIRAVLDQFDEMQRKGVYPRKPS